MNDLSGTIIKGYKLKERLDGGMGDVYRAIHPTFGTDVAMKVIKPQYANTPEFIRRFELEAQLINRLEHLHIVPLHDFWRDSNGAYLIMRWLRGGSLRKQIGSNGGLSTEDIVKIIGQVAQGLHHAHRNQIIHRDIKPENILLDEDGNAYVADFGIAKDHISGTNMTGNDIIGTPAYVSPEQARGERVTPQSDIYSLGVVLYEMLEQQHPFPNADPVALIFKQIDETLPELQLPDDDIRDAINDVVQKATAKDPMQRFRDVMEMAQALQEAAQLTPSQVEGFSLAELLTPREQEVMQLIIDGKSNREIADILVLEITTVKSYITSIYRKLKVRSRVQAIARARDLKFVIQKPETKSAIGTGLLPEPINPYKGLEAFTAGDAHHFFGREILVNKLLQRMQEDVEHQRFIAIVGPSGSGKSSVTKAGLVPALWRGDLPNSDNWYIAEMLPRAHPIDNLEVALVKIASENPQLISEQLSRDTRGLLRIANMILPDDGSELLIVIDQFEEVFTLVEDEDRRLHFLNLIREAVIDKDSRVRIVVTLRADYYDRPLQYPEFGVLMRNRLETVLPLTADELEQAIKQPAQNVGVKFENGLVSKIVSDVHYQPGALPLLQYALTELFERRDGRTLTLQAYTDIGGTGGALAKRADEIYLEGNDEGQALVKQLFLRLVTLGEGAEDTRRRVERVELLEITDDPELMDEIIDIYAQSRLLSLDNDPSTRKPTVEVAHEAILREWERLREWLNNSRDDIKQERQIAQEAEAWQVNNRDTSYLRTGSKLDQAEHWQKSTKLALTPLVAEFIQTSIKEAKAQELAERERIEREKQQEQRSRTLLRALVAVFAIAAVLSGGFGFVAMNERDNAKDAEYEASRQASIGLASVALRELDNGEQDRAVLLALEALEEYPYTSQAESALADIVEAYLPASTFEGQATLGNLKWSPDGSQIAGAEQYLVDGVQKDMISIVNADNSTSWISLSLEETGCNMSYVDWSPIGDRLVSIYARGVYSSTECAVLPTIWDVNAGEPLFQLDGHEGYVISVAWSPDGTAILTSGEDGTARVWNAQNGEHILTITGHMASVQDAVWSSVNNKILTGSLDNTARIWDATTGSEIATIHHTAGVTGVDWSPDDLYIITASEDGLARIWDAETLDLVHTLHGDTTMLTDVMYSPNGKRILTQSEAWKTSVWDADTGTLILSLPRFQNVAGGIQWSPDGQHVSALGKIWDISGQQLILSGHTANIVIGMWSPDGTRIVTTSHDGTARVWDAATGEELLVLEHPNLVMYSSLSPDGTRLVTSCVDGKARIWDIFSGELLLEVSLANPEAFLFDTVWSPDGTRIVSTDISWQTDIWDANTGEILTTLDFDKGIALLEADTDDVCATFSPTWSPDSTKIATGTACAEPIIWDASSGDPLMTFDGGFTVRVDWSIDGLYLASSSQDNEAFGVWDVSTGELLQTFTGHFRRGYAITWSPSGNRIVSGDDTGLVKIWDPFTGAELRSLSVPHAVLNVHWSPDENHIIITGFFNTPIIRRVWPSTQALIDEAYDCCVTRELTDEERQQFGLPVRDDG